MKCNHLTTTEDMVMLQNYFQIATTSGLETLFAKPWPVMGSIIISQLFEINRFCLGQMTLGH